MEDQFIRQSGIVDGNKLSKVNVTLVGAGGIGSVTASFLAKMGVKNFRLYDFDDVEVHNIPNQMFPISSVGQPKVDALAAHMRYMEGEDLFIECFNEKFTTKHRDESGILICAVDSMEAREDIWRAAKLSKSVMHFIDGRMGGWVCHRMYADMVQKEDKKYYESTLFADEEAVALPCTERAIIFNTGAIGSIIADTVAKVVQEHPVQRHVVYDMMNSAMLQMGE